MDAKLLAPEIRELYELDFLEWTARNAALLRAGRFSEADIDRIAEEIEDIGKSQQHALKRHLRMLLVHLLKWKFQPERRSVARSWRATIVIQRSDVSELLGQMPSLKKRLAEGLPDVYRVAVVEQILDHTFFPK